ncbi:MAG: sugar MFS transporter [Bacteroidaceae bacterium]|nr:sugar MFS transporter [Bacteroidaceae bacterium]
MATSKTITDKKYIIPFVLITSLFFMWGFARAILDVLNKHFQDSLHISITESALIQVVTYLGYFIMAIPAGLFINRFGYRYGVVFGLALFALGSFLFIPGAYTGTLGAFLACLFIIACGLAFLETSANPYVTELGPQETATSRLNLSQSFNGLGSSLAPFIIGVFLFGDNSSDIDDVALPYTIMGAIVVIVAIIFLFSELPDISHEEENTNVEDDDETGIDKLKRLFKNKTFLFGLIALLAYEVGEISINSYFVNFAYGIGLLDVNGASYTLSFSLFIFMGGRFLGSWIMKSVPAERFLKWCATGSVSCMLLLILTSVAENGEQTSWTRHLPIVFLMGNYFFEAIMFPTIFALSLRGLGNLTKSASSVLMMTPVGGCGFLVMAYLADVTDSYVIPFIIPLISFIIILAFSRKLDAGK